MAADIEIGPRTAATLSCEVNAADRTATYTKSGMCCGHILARIWPWKKGRSASRAELLGWMLAALIGYLDYMTEPFVSPDVVLPRPGRWRRLVVGQRAGIVVALFAGFGSSVSDLLPD